MTRDANPENTIHISSLMSHALDHATANESWQTMTRRHHRNCDRAEALTGPSPVLADEAAILDWIFRDIPGQNRVVALVGEEHRRNMLVLCVMVLWPAVEAGRRLWTQVKSTF